MRGKISVSWPECAGCENNMDIDWTSGTCPEMGTEECVQKKKQDRKTNTWDKRPEMLPGTIGYYDYGISKYPDRIRVSFSDGKTLVYEVRTEQPHPVIIENINIIKRMKQGYVNQPNRRRRRG